MDLPPFSILLNGALLNYFNGSRSLRQGDPLSPFVFLIVAKAFGRLLSRAYEGGLLEGFDIGGNGIVVSQLQFAYDTLIMCKDSVLQVRYLRCVIRCFEVVSGLKVN